jgi:predicted GNAT family N-acyltransferase
MGFESIQFGSAAYRDECLLRNEVLCIPLNLRLTDEDLSGEASQQHFGWFLADGSLAACVIAAALTPEESKIRQMAVRTDCQRRGLGRQLMQALEAHLSSHGPQSLQLHARATAVAFYESLGFTRIGEPFNEVGIPHLRMIKVIR